MLRIVLGVVAGFVAGFAIVFAVESAGHMMFPPPEGVNFTDPEELAAAVSQIPFEGFVAVLTAYFLGALGGASTANLVAGRRRLAGWIVSGIILAAVVANLLTIPHPGWFAPAALAVSLLGAVLADRAFGRPRQA